MGAEWVDVATRFIQQVGFPIFVAVFLLWDRHNMLVELKDELGQLRAVLEKVGERQ